MSKDNNVFTVPRLAGSRINAKNLINDRDANTETLIIDFSENESCSISFLQELVRLHLVLNGNMNAVLVFRNIRQSTVDKVDYIFNSFTNVRKRIIVQNVRE